MTPEQQTAALATSPEGVDAVRHGDTHPEWLADVVIGTVRREPTGPTGCGTHSIIAGLFSQFAAKAVAAERERVGTVLLGLACDGFNAEFTPDEWRQAIVTTAARIRESA